MSGAEANNWALAFARQSDADFKAWELYEKNPQALVAECHKLLFLQMACEKLCKAYLIRGETAVHSSQASHGYIEKPLPVVIKQQILHMKRNLDGMQGVLTLVRHLAGEIEILNPLDETRRPTPRQLRVSLGSRDAGRLAT